MTFLIVRDRVRVIHITRNSRLVRLERTCCHKVTECVPERKPGRSGYDLAVNDSVHLLSRLTVFPGKWEFPEIASYLLYFEPMIMYLSKYIYHVLII